MDDDGNKMKNESCEAAAKEGSEEASAANSMQLNPFDDPVQRTKFLIQYIKLGKKRVEAEKAKRTALKKQKMDARATLQRAREEKATAEAEEQYYANKIEELNQEKHQLLAALKSIHSRETERKRKREEQEKQRRLLAEEQRRIEEQRRLAQQQDYILQLKNAQQALNTIIASATVPSPSLLSLLMQNSTSAASSSTNIPIGGAAGGSTMPFLHQQPQQSKLTSFGMLSHPSSSTQAPSQQSSSQQLYLQQQQQAQNAVAQLLRQHLPSVSGAGMSNLLGTTPIGPGPPISQTPLSVLTNYPSQLQSFDLQNITATAQTGHQFPSALSIQALAAATASGTSSNSLNVTGFSSDLLYQAALLAATNLGSQPTGMLSSSTTPQLPRSTK